MPQASSTPVPRRNSDPRRRPQSPFRRLAACCDPRNKAAKRVDLVDMKPATSLSAIGDRTRRSDRTAEPEPLGFLEPLVGPCNGPDCARQPNLAEVYAAVGKRYAAQR